MGEEKLNYCILVLHLDYFSDNGVVEVSFNDETIRSLEKMSDFYLWNTFLRLHYSHLFQELVALRTFRLIHQIIECFNVSSENFISKNFFNDAVVKVRTS